MGVCRFHVNIVLFCVIGLASQALRTSPRDTEGQQCRSSESFVFPGPAEGCCSQKLYLSCLLFHSGWLM